MTCGCVPRLFHAGREDGLKLRVLLVAGDDGDLDAGEAGLGEERVELRCEQARAKKNFWCDAAADPADAASRADPPLGPLPVVPLPL